jgi:RNA polymerase sigma-70 factor (ECF subfamily)
MPGTETRQDRDFFSKQVDANLDRLYGHALLMTKNEACAEDLVAEGIAKAWKAIDSLEDPARFVPWVMRIMTNHFISEQRKACSKTRHIEYVEEYSDDSENFSLFEQLHQPFLLWWGNPEKEFLNDLLQQDIVAALEALPETFRIAVMMADIEGLSYQEISEALDVPIGTVRSRIARARSALQKQLWNHALEKGLIEPETDH